MLGSIGTNTATSIVEEMQNNNFESKAIKKAEEKLKKYEDEINITNKRISGLGQFKTFLEDLSSQMSAFTFSRSGKSGIFDAKKVVAPRELTENYANVKVKPGVINQNIPLEITQIAKGQILQSHSDIKPGDKIGISWTSAKLDWWLEEIMSSPQCDMKNKVILTVHDNGMSSKGFDAKDANVVGEGNNKFKAGKLSIGNSRKIEIKDGDTLEKIVNKINDATRTQGEENNPHAIAEVAKNKENKFFIWIRSDAKHHGVQNKFEINGDNKDQFTAYNEKIELSFDENATVGDFIADLKHNAKKADIEVIYNPKETKDGGKILLKSLLTGEGNDIKVEGHLHIDSNPETSCNHIHLSQAQEASDAKVKIDGITITSKTNTIEREDLKIDLFGKPKKLKSFNLRIENDTEGLYKKFKELAKSYNKFSKFVARNSLRVHDQDVHSKPSIIATLSTYKDTLSLLNDQLINYFSQFSQDGKYTKEDEISDLGISIISKELTEPSQKVDEVEENYMPVQYNQLVIDKKKLQKAIEERFDTFKEILSYQFDSTNTKFCLPNDHKTVNFEAQGVKSLEYDVDYTKVKYMSNISTENTANAKVNAFLSDQHYFLINDVKIPVDTDTTYASLVDEINKHSSTTKIRADLLDNSNKIVSDLATNPNVKIALSLYYKTEQQRQNAQKGQNALDKQDALRDKLVLVDPNDAALKGIFNSSSQSLDDTTENPILDDKIPQINFFDTFFIVEVKANLKDYETTDLPAYLELMRPKKPEEGGVIKILPKLSTAKSDKHIDLQNFKVAYLAETNGKATITAKQGIADKINNILNSYTEFNGMIEKFIKHEKRDKMYKENDLSFEKDSFKYKKAKIERDFARIKAAEMRAAVQQEFFRQVFGNSNDKN